jgi:hypothetical protein
MPKFGYYHTVLKQKLLIHQSTFLSKLFWKSENILKFTRFLCSISESNSREIKKGLSLKTQGQFKDIDYLIIQSFECFSRKLANFLHRNNSIKSSSSR